MSRQSEIIRAAVRDSKLIPLTVAAMSHELGAEQHEPILCGLAGMVRYAEAYALRFEARLSDDGVLGPCFLDAIRGLRGLLDGDGTIAMERGISTDSKDNGVCECLFWKAMDAAGFEESDL